MAILEPGWMTSKEVRFLFGVTKATLQNWKNRGNLAPRAKQQIGSGLPMNLYRTEEVNQWYKERMTARGIK